MNAVVSIILVFSCLLSVSSLFLNMQRLILVQDSITSQLMSMKIKLKFPNAFTVEHQKNVIAVFSRMINGRTINVVLIGALKSLCIPVRCEKNSLVEATDKDK